MLERPRGDYDRVIDSCSTFAREPFVFAVYLEETPQRRRPHIGFFPIWNLVSNELLSLYIFLETTIKSLIRFDRIHVRVIGQL